MIRELQKGDRLTADWARGLVRALRRCRVTAGHGLRAAETPDGTVISLAQQPPAARSAPALSPPQWQLDIVAGPEGASLLRVRRGIVSYGGGHWAVWPSGGHDTSDAWQDIPLDFAAGGTMLVLWHTSEPPVPLHNCPLQPSGPAPDFRLSGADCACTLSGYPVPGDPGAYSPGPGEVSLHEPGAAGSDADGWTDCVPLGVVTRHGDSYTATQIHDCTIAVRAIVRGGEDDPGDPGAPPTDPDAPPCGHPGNNPGGGGGGEPPGGGGGDHPGGGDDDHPGDNPSPPSSGDCP